MRSLSSLFKRTKAKICVLVAIQLLYPITARQVHIFSAGPPKAVFSGTLYSRANHLLAAAYVTLQVIPI